MMFVGLLPFLAVVLAAQQPPRGEIQERLDAAPSFTLYSQKRPVDLEFCVADALSKIATPSAFSDGPDRRIVIASITLGKVVAAVELKGSAAGTTIIGRIHGRGWDDRVRTRIAWCL